MFQDNEQYCIASRRLYIYTYTYGVQNMDAYASDSCFGTPQVCNIFESKWHFMFALVQEPD